MDTYQAKIQQCNDDISRLQKTSDMLSILRLVVFALSLILIVVLANERLFMLVSVVAPICVVGFALLIKRHNQVDALKEFTSLLKEVNEQEVLRMDNKLADLPTGAEFGSRNHPYTADMDIFGKHSVFQLINRATTESGRETLAKWLSHPASNPEIVKRQQAVKELSSKFEWRQHLQASGMKFIHTASDYNELNGWAEKPVRLLSSKVMILSVCITLSLLATVAAVYFFSHVLGVSSPEQLVPYLIPLGIVALINTFVLKRFNPIAEELTHNIHRHINILRGYRSIITAIESERFESEVPRQLLTLINTSGSAVSEIKRLESILDMFKLKGGKRQFNNMFYGMLNSLFLFDVYLIILSEQWKVRNKASLARWSAVVGEFEALNSIAGFYYANPSYQFAEIQSSNPYYMRFEKIGHPLISSERRVCNDFELSGRGTIAVITGSNMAGKSTFLRTLGVNMVLSLMGAPCCAASASLSNLGIFTSMRTQDSLEEGVSSFYAELRRIQQLLEKIEDGHPLFFLLDEIFKGTNSNDRHKGGFSLIKQLGALNAFGIVSTHDLELATLAEQDNIANYSFNSKLSEGQLEFDYCLTEGQCTDFNASELMRKSGIKIL
jgi:hypothetical protein